MGRIWKTELGRRTIEDASVFEVNRDSVEIRSRTASY